MKTIATVFLLWGLAYSPCLLAASGLELVCNTRSIANHLMNGEIQKALDVSLACESRDLRNIKEPFAEQDLKGAYLVSAQLLTAQGKFAVARARVAKAKKLSGNFSIKLQPLLDTTRGYLLERTGQSREAINFYRRIAKPYALARLGAVYLEQGRLDDAKRVIFRCLRDSPSSPAAHAILGEILQGSDAAEALREYRQAVVLATHGNPTIVPLVYLEVAKAKRGIKRLQKS